MPYIKKDHPLILFKGMNSNLFDKITNTYIVNWTSDILDSLNTKEEFNELLTTTFKDNLVTNNVNDSTFDNDADGIGIWLAYGISSGGSSLGDWTSAWTMANNGPAIFSVENIKKPTKIHVKFSYEDNSSSFSHFSLRFIGNISNEKYIPIIFNDGYLASGGAEGISGNGVMINHNKIPVQNIVSGKNYYDFTLDTNIQLSECFTNPSDTSYTLDFVSLATVKGGSTRATTPLYLEQLSIEV